MAKQFKINIHKEWERFKVPFIDEGSRGNLRVERFEVTEADAKFDRMRAAIGSFGSGGRFCLEGRYTRLWEGKGMGVVWMSDTRDEIMDHRWLLSCHGSVLVHGLGLGVALNMLIQNPRVEKIDVVEISQDVVDLVWPHFENREGNEKLEIRVADALDYKVPRGTRYDFAWHDIWPDICGDNFESMKALHRRFAHRVEVEQQSWQRAEVKRSHRQWA